MPSKLTTAKILILSCLLSIPPSASCGDSFKPHSTHKRVVVNEDNLKLILKDYCKQSSISVLKNMIDKCKINKEKMTEDYIKQFFNKSMTACLGYMVEGLEPKETVDMWEENP